MNEPTCIWLLMVAMKKFNLKKLSNEKHERNVGFHRRRCSFVLFHSLLQYNSKQKWRRRRSPLTKIQWSTWTAASRGQFSFFLLRIFVIVVRARCRLFRRRTMGRRGGSCSIDFVDWTYYAWLEMYFPTPVRKTGVVGGSTLGVEIFAERTVPFTRSSFASRFSCRSRSAFNWNETKESGGKIDSIDFLLRRQLRRKDWRKRSCLRWWCPTEVDLCRRLEPLPWRWAFRFHRRF